MLSIILQAACKFKELWEKAFNFHVWRLSMGLDNIHLWSFNQFIWQATVVQRLDSFIRWITHYPVDKMYWLEHIIFIHWIAVYPVDKVIPPWNNWGHCLVPRRQFSAQKQGERGAMGRMQCTYPTTPRAASCNKEGRPGTRQTGARCLPKVRAKESLRQFDKDSNSLR